MKPPDDRAQDGVRGRARNGVQDGVPSRPDREPTRDELLAMAYADGQLPPDERQAFERRLAQEPAIARAVAEFRSLEILARQMAPPEPADHEWARLELDVLQRSGSWLGLLLLCAGALGLAAWFVLLVVRSEMSLLPRAGLLALIGGLLLLLGLTVRARLRLLPYDPYRKVKR